MSVEQADLIRSTYKLLYKRTLDAVMTSPKIPVQAPRKFLAKLVARGAAHAPQRTDPSAACAQCTAQATAPRVC